jgi:hypothetical protein
VEEKRAILEQFRNLAEQMRSPERKPFLAPWWQSPQLAYWSGQPGVAGTSHQSLAGIVDSARFFMAEKPEDGAEILRRRGVRWVVIDDQPIENTSPTRYGPVDNAAKILSYEQMPAEPLGWKLAESHHQAPPYLRYIKPEERGLVYDMVKKSTGEKEKVQLFFSEFWKLYEVLPDKL